MVDNAKDRLGGVMDDAKQRGRDEMDQKVNAGEKSREGDSSGSMQDKIKDGAMDKAKEFGNR